MHLLCSRMALLRHKFKDLSQLKLNTLANYVGRLWSSLLSFFLVPVYLHYLGVEAYGLIGGFFTVTSFIELLDLGLSTTVNREVALRQANPQKQVTIPSLLRTTEIIYWSVGLIILILMILLSEPIATQWINAQKMDLLTVKWAVIILGLTVAIRWPITPYRGTLMGLQKQVQVNILETTLKTVKELGAVIILVKISPTIIAFLQWQAVIGILEVIFMMMLAWHNIPKVSQQAKFETKILQEIWQFAAGISWSMLVSLILAQVDKVLLTKFVSLELFGYYILAATLAERICLFLDPFLVALSPQIIALLNQDKTVDFSLFFHKCSLFISLIITPLAGMLMFFAPTVLELWTRSTDVAVNASSILVILTLGAILNLMTNLSYQIQLALGKPYISAFFNTCSVAIVVPAMLLIVPKFHLFGAALVRTLLNVLYYLILSRMTHLYILQKEHLRWMLQDTLVPMLLCFTVFLLASRLQILFPGKIIAILLILLALISSYSLLVWWYKYQLRQLKTIYD